MFKMFAQVFASITVLFSAAEKGANALNNVATVAEEASEGYRDIERLKREAKINAMKAELTASQPKLVASQDQAAL